GTASAVLTITITGTNDAPVASTIPDQSNTDSDPVAVDVSGFFSDTDTTDTLTYSATNLPPGLNIDPNTGVISGTLDHSASQGGPYTVTVTADDGNGGVTPTTFVWNVVNLPPTATNNTNAVT